MLDLRFIRENTEAVKKSLKNRNLKLDTEKLLSFDKERRELLSKVEELKHKKKESSRDIGLLIKEDKATDKEKEEMKTLSHKIKEIDEKVGEIDQKITTFLYNIPNIPHKSVPIGKNDKANKIIREWGKIRELEFKAQNHLNIAEQLDIIDFERATKISGTNFSLYKGFGATLERALINFMLDLHTQKHGYTEIWPPALVNRNSMFGTGQLPKLEEDMYKLKDDDYFLIPTAEVPVTNMHRQETLESNILPLYYTAYTPCFRREAGSYGKDTRGLIRVHQFDKVELVKLVKPETSYEELEKLLKDAEEVLQLLELPYRINALSTGELSFAAAKCYDIEVWASGTNAYLEVSSCSNFESFQARRAGIRFKDPKTGEKGFVHTLNGSGVALARTVVAILENYQQKDGSVLVPKVLQKYMNNLKVIKSAK